MSRKKKTLDKNSKLFSDIYDHWQYQPALGRRDLAKLSGYSEWECRAFLNTIKKEPDLTKEMVDTLLGQESEDDYTNSETQAIFDPTPVHNTTNNTKRDKYLATIAERYDDNELLALSKATIDKKEYATGVNIDFGGDEFIIGVVSDTHFGSIYTPKDIMKKVYEEFDKQNVDIVVHSGDVTEGFGRRDGMVFEQSHIGYGAQLENAIEELSPWDKTPLYMISGNHDLWYKSMAGADIVSEICKNIPNAEYLGEHSGDIKINDGEATIRLWHGEDGSSYAHSYRLQKVVETFSGGDKPNILIAGHVHKAIYMFDRNIHCLSAGCIQRQSNWMKNKRLSAHTGFWIIKVIVNEFGVASFSPTFYPLYV